MINSYLELQNWLNEQTKNPPEILNLSMGLFGTEKAKMVRSILDILSSGSLEVRGPVFDSPAGTITGIVSIFNQENVYGTLTFQEESDPEDKKILTLNVHYLFPEDFELEMIEGIGLYFSGDLSENGNIDKGIRYNVYADTRNMIISSQFYCSIRAQELAVPVKLNVPTYEGDWLLVDRIEENCPVRKNINENTLIELAGGHDLPSLLPETIRQQINKLSITEFRTAFNPFEQTCPMISVCVEYSTDCSWLDGKIEINNIYMVLRVLDPLNNFSLEGVLGGIFSIDGHPIDVSVSLHDLVLYTRLAEKNGISFRNIANQFNSLVALPVPGYLSETIETTEISKLDFMVYLLSGTFSFNMEIDTQVKFFQEFVTLEKLYWDIAYDGMAFSCAIAGNMNIGNASIFLSARYTKNNQSELVLEGEAANISIADFMQFLTSKLGIEELPDSLSTLRIDSLSLIYNTKTHKLVSILESGAPWNIFNEPLSLSVESIKLDVEVDLSNISSFKINAYAEVNIGSATLSFSASLADSGKNWSFSIIQKEDIALPTVGELVALLNSDWTNQIPDPLLNIGNQFVLKKFEGKITGGSTQFSCTIGTVEKGFQWQIFSSPIDFSFDSADLNFTADSDKKVQGNVEASFSIDGNPLFFRAALPFDNNDYKLIFVNEKSLSLPGVGDIVNFLKPADWNSLPPNLITQFGTDIVIKTYSLQINSKDTTLKTVITAADPITEWPVISICKLKNIELDLLVSKKEGFTGFIKGEIHLGDSQRNTAKIPLSVGIKENWSSFTLSLEPEKVEAISIPTFKQMISLMDSSYTDKLPDFMANNISINIQKFDIIITSVKKSLSIVAETNDHWSDLGEMPSGVSLGNAILTIDWNKSKGVITKKIVIGTNVTVLGVNTNIFLELSNKPSNKLKGTMEKPESYTVFDIAALIFGASTVDVLPVKTKEYLKQIKIPELSISFNFCSSVLILSCEFKEVNKFLFDSNNKLEALKFSVCFEPGNSPKVCLTVKWTINTSLAKDDTQTKESKFCYPFDNIDYIPFPYDPNNPDYPEDPKDPYDPDNPSGPHYIPHLEELIWTLSNDLCLTLAVSMAVMIMAPTIEQLVEALITKVAVKEAAKTIVELSSVIVAI